jgi:opacity protein-like surface antigen
MQRLLTCVAIAGAAAIVAAPAAAQTSSGSTSARGGPMGWMPGAGGTGYVGLNVGRSRYHAECGVRDVLRNLDLECGLHDVSYHLYAGGGLGGMGGMPNMFGAELGYIDMGHVSRGGGETRARGVNLSLVAKAPIAAGFGVFGKVGTTYGWTRTSTSAGSSVPAGKENGFGLSYGVGASYDFTPNVSAVLAWDSHDFRFAGTGRDPIRVTSLGVQYRY